MSARLLLHVAEPSSSRLLERDVLDKHGRNVEFDVPRMHDERYVLPSRLNDGEYAVRIWLLLRVTRDKSSMPSGQLLPVFECRTDFVLDDKWDILRRGGPRRAVNLLCWILLSVATFEFPVPHGRVVRKRVVRARILCCR